MRGPQLDHWVDRPEVEARTIRLVKLTGTNKPITYTTQHLQKMLAFTMWSPTNKPTPVCAWNQKNTEQL